jgi:hypothetical protein
MKCLLVTLLLLFVVRPVSAKERVYAIRELRVDGEMTETERQRLRERTVAAADVAFGAAGGSIVPLPDVERVLAERPELRRCYDWRCNVVIADQLGATRVVVVRIERKGLPSEPGSWEVTALNFASDALRLVGTKVESCDGCVAEDLIRRNVITRVLSSLSKQDTGELALCRLKVDSEPGEAAIIIDKTPLGTTPLERTVAAGTHTVSVELKGYGTNQTVIECPKDGEQRLRMKLTAGASDVQPPATQPDRRPLYKGLGFASLGLAVLSLGGLGAAAAYHDRPSCGEARCPRRYDTSAGIGVSVGAFVAFAVVGSVLLWKGYQRPSRARAWYGGASLGVDQLGFFVGRSFQ